METPRDPILQDLIDHEKSVAGKVEAARAEAERIVAHARGEATEVVERAKREGEALAAEIADRSRREADDAREAILGAAHEAVAEIEARAAARLTTAVEAVVKQVVP